MQLLYSDYFHAFLCSEEQNEAIERALASRRPAVSAVAGGRGDIQAAA